MISANRIYLAAFGIICLNLGGCVTASNPPPAPSFIAVPGKGKSYEVFQKDDLFCQQSAQRSIGDVSPSEIGNQNGVATAATGAVVGTLAGAAIGAASGHAGTGAAIGAGSGLVAGSLIGANQARSTAANAQGQYDRVYAQCMSSKGNTINFAPPPSPVGYVYTETYPVYAYPRYYYYGYWGPGYYRRRW
jgi:uncharacterized protein YcfJ